MKSLYITSVERYSGKTAACLAIGKHFQANGYKVGYLKPLSIQPWRVQGKIADQDAAFVKDALDLEFEPWDLSPVVVTSEMLREHLKGKGDTDLLTKVKNTLVTTSQGQNIMLLEGGGSLREGYAVGLPTPLVAEKLNSLVLSIIRYRDDVQLIDDALATRARLGNSLCGLLFNRIPRDASTFIHDQAIPYIENQGIPVFGALPEVKELAALTVKEIKDSINAKILTENTSLTGLVENLTVGAMTADAALSRFRRQKNKAVITGGDRTDIQLAALETSTACLMLTGNLHPSPLIIKQANELGVPILITRYNTMETVEAIEKIFGKTNLGQEEKLRKFQDLLNSHSDMKRLYSLFDLE